MRHLSLGLLVAVVGFGTLVSCVHHARTNGAYPSRPPNCTLRIFSGPVPRGIYFDDIGPVDAGCYLETTRTECLRQLRAQACKMGGDIVYDLPDAPTRPEWREYHYKGTVAHSRPMKKEDVEEGRAPEDAVVEGSAKPEKDAAKTTSPDAGVSGDEGGDAGAAAPVPAGPSDFAPVTPLGATSAPPTPEHAGAGGSKP